MIKILHLLYVLLLLLYYYYYYYYVCVFGLESVINIDDNIIIKSNVSIVILSSAI